MELLAINVTGLHNRGSARELEAAYLHERAKTRIATCSVESLGQKLAIRSARFLAVRMNARPIGRSSIIIVYRLCAKEIESEVCMVVCARARAFSLAAIFSRAGITLASDRRNMILPRTDSAIRGNAE